MAESLGEAVLDLRADHRKFDSAVDGAKRKAESLDQTFTRIGRNLSKFGSRMTLGVTLPLAAAGAAAFKLASDAEEASNKFEIVMGGSADRVRASLKELEGQIPLTTGELLNLAAGTQDLLVPMGLARDAGAEMSVQFIELAGDISAFNNVPVAQVLADIKSGLVGSSEPLFKYGVDTRVAALETVALANGLIEEGEKLDDVARAQAVLLQIQAQSTDAMGAAQREAEGAAQQMAFLFREVRQLGEEIGRVLIPIFVPMISGLRDAVTWFRNLSPEVQGLVVKVGLFAAAIGPIAFIVGKLTTGLGLLIPLIQTTTIALGFKTAATVVDTAAMVANTTAVAGLIPTQAAAAASTTALAGTGQDLALSMRGNAGLIAAVGGASFALGLWIEKTFIARNATADWLEWIGLAEQRVKLTAAELEHMANTVGMVTTSTTSVIPIIRSAAEASAAWADSGGAAKKMLEGLDEALSSLGFRTLPSVVTEMDALELAISAGIVPAEQLSEKFDDMLEELEELGLLTPEVTARLAELRAEAELLDPALVDMGDAMDHVIVKFEEFLDDSDPVEDFMVTMPEVVPEVTSVLDDFFGSMFDGIPILEDLGSSLDGLLGGFTDFLGGLFGGGGDGGDGGGFFDSILGLFGGGGGDGDDGDGDDGGGFFASFGEAGENTGAALISGFTSALAGGAGAVQSAITGLVAAGLNFIPVIGPLLSSLAAPIVDFFAGLFSSGPDAAELAARDIVHELDAIFAGMLDANQLAETGGEAWANANVAIRDSYLALGFSLEAAQAEAARLADAVRESPEAAQIVADEIQANMALVQQAMATTGLSLTELRDKAISDAARLGITVAESFQMILNGVNETATVGAARWESWTDGMARSMDRSTDRITARIEALGLPAEREAARIARAMERAAGRIETRFEETPELVSASMASMAESSSASMGTIADVAITSARRTEDAWVASATATTDAWQRARRETVGASSITDIGEIGSDAATRLGEQHQSAASATADAWRRANRQILGGGPRRSTGSISDLGGDGASPLGFAASTAGRGGRGGNLTLELVLDRSGGEVIARKMIKITPEIRRKMGLE